MFPAGVITRELKVGPAFDLLSGAPYAIRVMVSPTRTVVWGATGDPVVSKLSTYTAAPDEELLISLPVTNQNGYITGSGGSIVLEPGDHAFGYKVSVFYLKDGSVVRKLPASTVVLPTGVAPIDIDELVTYSTGNSGSVISTPDTWSAQVAAAQAAAVAAAASAQAAEDALTELEGDIGSAVEGWFDDNPSAVVSPETLEDAIDAHKNEPTPHTAYDLDIPSLTVLFENGLA